MAFVAQHLVSTNLPAGQIDGQLKQLALIESAGEAMVFIPLGAVSLWWYLGRMRAAGRTSEG